MKSKVFKFVLPAFAFAFAIVASFAFTTAENPTVQGYIQNGSQFSCIQSIDTCVEGPTANCETLSGQPVYKLESTTCSVQLSRP